VAHDGSISRLLAILQIEKMIWPGMATEVVFELYSKQGCYYLRVLFGGQVLVSSHPSFGSMDMIDVTTFLAYIDGLVGVGANKVPGLCSS
jgi:acid phosphatase